MWGRDKIGRAAQELADHLKLVENVKALQQAQKEMADAISLLNDRIRDLSAELKVLKAEARAEAIKETSLMLNAVQGAFNDKLNDVRDRVAHLERQGETRDSFIALAKSATRVDGELPPG